MIVVALAIAANAADPRCSNVTTGAVLGFGHNAQEVHASDPAGCCTACCGSFLPYAYRLASLVRRPLPNCCPPSSLSCSHMSTVALCCRSRDFTVKHAGCAAWSYHKTATYACVLHSQTTPITPMPGAVSGYGVPPALHCLGETRGCFKDFIPAPGVPPVRPLDHLASGPTQNMSVAGCASACAALGYPLGGVTSGSLDNTHGTPSPMYSCYCGCQLNEASPALPNQTCAAPCSGAPPGDGPCGAPGAMATFVAECVPRPPPSTVCNNGTKPLPPGPACSQAAAKGWKFCDTSIALDDRVTDLVDRLLMSEAGPLLTARESPAIPRLGIPSF